MNFRFTISFTITYSYTISIRFIITLQNLDYLNVVSKIEIAI